MYNVVLVITYKCKLGTISRFLMVIVKLFCSFKTLPNGIFFHKTINIQNIATKNNIPYSFTIMG